MAKKQRSPNPDDLTSTGLRVAARERFRQMADDRGMNINRLPDLLLSGWDLLTPEQEFEAMRRMSRTPQSEAVPA